MDEKGQLIKPNSLGECLTKLRPEHPFMGGLFANAIVYGLIFVSMIVALHTPDNNF